MPSPVLSVRNEATRPSACSPPGSATFWRQALDAGDRQLVSLGEEMEFLQKYLDIQKIRFGERLQVGVDVPDSLKIGPGSQHDPAADGGEFLQAWPWAKQARGGADSRGQASCAGTMLTLSVYNDGPGLTERSRPAPGRRRHRQYTRAPEELLWRPLRPGPAQSGERCRGVNCRALFEPGVSDAAAA